MSSPSPVVTVTFPPPSLTVSFPPPVFTVIFDVMAEVSMVAIALVSATASIVLSPPATAFNPTVIV